MAKKGNTHKRSEEDQQPEQAQDQISQAINNGIKAGIYKISAINPRFKGQENYIQGYMDKNMIYRYRDKAINELMNKDGQIDLNRLSLAMTEYTIKGLLFDKDKKKAIIGKGLEGKITKGDKELGEAIETSRRLYDLAEQGGYSKSNPEITKILGSIYNLGFYQTAVEALYESGFMSNKEYKEIGKNIKKRAREGMNYVKSNIEQIASTSYVQKAAAVIGGIIGVLVILSTTSMTGAAIGSPAKTILHTLPAVLWGLAVLGAGLFIYSKTPKKKLILKNKIKK